MKDFIAIFDSGIGGLTVYKDIKENLKNENFVYLADTLNCPYGVKTLEEVKQITLSNINYLKRLGAKAIVIACNTATSSVLKEIEENSGYLIGVIEATARAAYVASNTKKIGLFATNLTVKTKVYDNYLQDATLLSEGCSDFVPLIEAGKINTEEMKLAVNNHLSKVEGIDTLILGCTHFPFIKDIIKDNSNIENIVSSGIPTLNVLKKYLIDNNKISNYDKPTHLFLTTGEADYVKNQIKDFGFEFNEVKQIRIK